MKEKKGKGKEKARMTVSILIVAMIVLSASIALVSQSLAASSPTEVRTLSLSANPPTVTPGNVSEIVAKVREDGSPVPEGINVTFETDFGILTESRGNTYTAATNERGIAIAHFVADVSGTANITATEPTGASDMTKVVVAPLLPRTVDVWAEPSRIAPGDVSAIFAKVMEDGSAMENVSVDFETDFGIFRESRSNTYTAATNERGIAIAHFAADESGTANITATEPTGVSNTIVVIIEVVPLPDLIVTEIKPNCDNIFANESNNITATIKNNGTADADAFNVSIAADGFSEKVSVGGLAAGATTTVYAIDTSIRYAGGTVTITVTADCDGAIVESDETNNATSIVDIEVKNNGYKGKRYTGGDDITTWKTFDLKGDLLYSLGDSYYLSGATNWTTYIVNWTASDLPVPGTATIKEARLYVIYTWDKAGVMPDNVNMSFNGVTQTRDAHYSDRKGYSSYDYPYGMLAYNITADFNTSGNIAVLTNSHTGGGNVSMRGMLLVAVYADDSESQRQIFVNEEFDLLHGGSSQCTTPEEATAYAPITGPTIDIANVTSAKLITVAPGASGPEGDLIFNGQTWTDVWNFTTAAEIGIDECDVTAYLQATGNEAGFRSDGDYGGEQCDTGGGTGITKEW